MELRNGNDVILVIIYYDGEVLLNFEFKIVVEVLEFEDFLVSFS